jgi:hypothetical protein
MRAASRGTYKVSSRLYALSLQFPDMVRPQLTLNFGGRTWPMASDDFALPTNDPDTCVGAIFETTLGDSDNAQIPQCRL